jgi:hypothetical protein
MPAVLSEPQTISTPEAPPKPDAATIPDRLFRRLLPELQRSTGWI